MLRKNRTLLIVIALGLLTLLFAWLHLSTRIQVAPGSLLIETQGRSVILDITEVPQTPVTGQTVNGRGEVQTLDGTGIVLAELLDMAGVSLPEIGQVTVFAADEYSAVLFPEELSEHGKIYLLLEEDASLRLVVFGDENSKRRVRNVVRLVIS